MQKNIFMRLLLIFLFFTISSHLFSQPQQEVKMQLDSLVSYIKNKATESFAENTVYKGEDPKRKWNAANNPASPEELKAGKEMMEEFKKAFSECNHKEFDTFRGDKQREGIWYVYTYACGASKKIHLAFLKIGAKYALGDIDIEDDDD